MLFRSYSAQETVRIAPEIARIYPTVVIHDTALYDMMEAGTYEPLSTEEAIHRSKAIYEILDNAGINIIRVGLKSSDIIGNETAFHPAFRQLVEGRIARERLEAGLATLLSENPPTENSEILFFSNEKCYNDMFGHKACNRKYFAQEYPAYAFRYCVDPQLKNNEYSVKLANKCESDSHSSQK